VDLHLKGMEALGADVELEGGYIVARAERLRGAEIRFPISSVGATGNVLMAAVLADGVTVLDNAAREPEIMALADFLNAMGADVRGAGGERIEIHGVAALSPTTWRVIPDRIEAGTYVIAGAMAGGTVLVQGLDPSHLGSVLACLSTMGIDLEVGEDWIRVAGTDRPGRIDIETLPYPGFPTDLQAQLMAMASVARGRSRIVERIYPDRFKHVPELVRLGARIAVDGAVATVTGVEELDGAPVMASDLRASAALVLGGLVARGTTRVARVYHIDRGYVRIEDKLAALGARVERIRD
jgi:UDP-N-acetylglucosamine 1-carboxyvinyltransferase